LSTPCRTEAARNVAGGWVMVVVGVGMVDLLFVVAGLVPAGGWCSCQSGHGNGVAVLILQIGVERPNSDRGTWASRVPPGPSNGTGAFGAEPPPVSSRVLLELG
jgi:hypothetical protein